MNKTPVKTVSAMLLPAVATMLFVQACCGSDWAIAQDAADPIEGVWESVVSVRDCTTNAVTGTFRGVNVMHRGGTLTDTNGSSPTSRGPGFGVWSKSGDGSYAVKFRFYRYNTDGSLAGSNVVTSTRKLGANGNSLEASTRTEVRDLTGNVLQTLCVTDLGTRAF